MSRPLRRVALTRELPGDLDTPVGVYLKLANRPFGYLLESVQGGERWGRYSFIGLPCSERLVIRGDTAERWRGAHCLARQTVTDPIAWLREQTGDWRVEPPPGLPRFHGGWVGYVGYEAVRWFEPRVRADKPDPIGTPDVLLMRSEELAVFDNLRATLTLVVHADPDDADDMARAEARLDSRPSCRRRPRLRARRCRATTASRISSPAPARPSSVPRSSACATTSPPATACRWCCRSACRPRSTPIRWCCTGPCGG